MPIGVKAVFSYSATAATTTAWTLTASTSVAVGDVLVLTAGYRGSASHSISAIGDNAGNSWSRAIEQSSLGFTSAIWYAPVSTTTSNFAVAVGLIDGRTVSARAAHILVLSGVDIASPFDPGTSDQMALVASTATTASLSTSAATAVADEILVVTATQNNIDSATINAAAGWTARGGVLSAASGAIFKKYLWTYSASTTAVYAFSASLSNGGSTRTRQFQIAGFRPAPAGALSGSQSFGFAAVTTLEARGRLQGDVGTSLAASGELRGIVPASGQADLTFDASGSGAATGDLRGGATLAFAASGGGAGSASPTASAALSATLLGGGWDRRLFRRVLADARRNGPLDASDAASVALLDDPGVTDRADLRRMIVGAAAAGIAAAEQARALSGIAQELRALDVAIDAQWQEREAEALLLLAA